MLRQKQRESGIFPRFHGTILPEPTPLIGMDEVFELLQLSLKNRKTLIMRIPHGKTKEDVVDAIKKHDYVILETDKKILIQINFT